jgi:hypothetical protein
MSDTYVIDGVTVAPLGGGFYELTHPSLSEPEKVRGKENADRRASEIGTAALTADDDDGAQLQQGDFNPADIAATLTPVGDSDEVAALKAQLAASEAQRDAAEAENAELRTKTVVTDGGDTPVNLRELPREYTGTMPKASRDRFARLGVELVDIVLEENDNIPPTGLFLSHNGTAYMIKPGEKVTVPEFLTEILDHAITAVAVTGDDKNIIGYRNRMRYPYRIVKG